MSTVKKLGMRSKTCCGILYEDRCFYQWLNLIQPVYSIFRTRLKINFLARYKMSAIASPRHKMSSLCDRVFLQTDATVTHTKSWYGIPHACHTMYLIVLVQYCISTTIFTMILKFCQIDVLGGTRSTNKNKIGDFFSNFLSSNF